MLLFSDVLYMLVRYASPSGPMCLRCLMLTLSGPVEFFLFVCLFVLCVLCLTVLVNCLLNEFAICVGEVNVFSLKVMVFLLGCVGFCWLIRVYCLPKSMCVVFVIPLCV